MASAKTWDITGQRFGNLVARERAGRTAHKHVLWLCVCDCGLEAVVEGRVLRAGQCRSCGCLTPRSKTYQPEDAQGCEVG